MYHKDQTPLYASLSFSGAGIKALFHASFYVIRNFDKPVALLATWFHADFMLRLFFGPEVGGSMCLQNVC
jgi:hypothetical protein